MTKDQENKAIRHVPAVCAVASLAGALLWSPAAILVGFAVVAIVGTMGTTTSRAIDRTGLAAVASTLRRRPA